METTKAIQMIPIDQLSPHPDNPRKNLGDLTELAASIRENGVLQNLTVVPWMGEVTGTFTGKYKVIIGHRRLAAAKLAGLTELPCHVTTLTPSEQIKTMLMENMQRSDLTLLEQSDGFQMMLDLGLTIEQVANESGFSESTVRRRLKLRELDRQALEERLLKGATLMDLVKLEQLEDEKIRNKVLATVGTNNFEYELRTALDKQACKRNKSLWEKVLDSFAQRIPKEEANSRKWGYGGWGRLSDDPNAYVVPGDTETVTYGYIIDGSSYSLRKLRDDAEELDEEDNEKAELARQVKEVEKTLDDSSAVAYRLRLDFIRSTPLRKKHIPDTLAYLMRQLNDNRAPSHKTKAAALNVETGKGWSEDRKAASDSFDALMSKDPDKALLIIAYAVSDDDAENSYVESSWRNDEYPVYCENKKLDALYDFLELLGYQISDEERLLMSGEHPAYQPGAEQQAENPDEEDEDDD